MKSLVPSKKFRLGKSLTQQKILFRFSPEIQQDEFCSCKNRCQSHAQCSNTFASLQYLSNSSISIPCQIKYYEPGIIHTLVHRFLLQYRRSAVKLKHWYFLLVSRDFHCKSILAVIMPDRNRNSVAIIATLKF